MPGRTPDYRYVVKTVLTPAATASSAPLKTVVDLGQVTLLEVQIRIPDGHAGQTGVAVVSDNFGVVPWDPKVSYIIGNNEEPVFPLDMTMGHAIAVWTYNTGAFDHRHFLRFKVRDSSLDINAGGPLLAVVKDIPDAGTSAAVDTTGAADDGSTEAPGTASGDLTGVVAGDGS